MAPTSTGMAMSAECTRRPRPRMWIAGLAAGLALGLALSGVALACEPTPVNCGPIVFRPTGRPLEMEVAVGGCSYDTRNFQVSVWVRLRGFGYDPQRGRTIGGNSDVGVTGSESLVSLTRVTMLKPGVYGLEIEAFASSRYGGDVCYAPGTRSVWVTLAAAKPTPRPTARPTPRPTPKPTPRPTPRPTPKPTATPRPSGTSLPTPASTTASPGSPSASPQSTGVDPGSSVASSSNSVLPVLPANEAPPPTLLVVLAGGGGLAVLALALLVVFRRRGAGASGAWVCPACHSINERGHQRCYSCRGAR